MSTMKALVLHAVGDARVQRVPTPAVTRDRVRIRVGFCGVCGSDIPRIFVNGTYSFPTVCGHEFSGIVEECGPGVQDLEAGERVAVFPLLWCGCCPACEQGRFVQCHDYDYLGSRCDGAFAEYVIAPRRNLLKIPEGVSLEEAAMTEPASVALHALRQGGGTTPGDIVAIFGSGPIGLMIAQWARTMGASRIILFDVVPEKLELARSLGFSDVFDSRDADAVKTINDLTAGHGVHLAVEAAGVPSTFLQAVESTRRGGRVVLMGNPSGDVTLPAALLSQILRREIRLHGTWNSDFSAAGNDDDWHTSLRAMAQKRLELLPLITHRVALDDSFSILRSMKEGSGFFSKVLIHP